MAVKVPVRDPGRAVDEETQLAPRPPGRPRLEGLAARHHQRDDRRRELLAQDQGAGDRDQGDRVDPDVAVEEATARLDRQRNEDDRRSDRPRSVRPAVSAGQPEDPPGDEPGERDHCQRALAHP